MRQRHAPATQRNREPILEVLREALPTDGALLEIASGSGEHAAFFAPLFPGLSWQPSDGDPDSLVSIDAWRKSVTTPNLLGAIHLDVRSPSWPVGELDAVFNANMIHIAPWACCLGLLAGAARHLRTGGVLVMYGPYKIGGEHTAASNEAFDRSLRERDREWGVRDLETVETEAAARGLALLRRAPMPANNQTLVFRREAHVGG